MYSVVTFGLHLAKCSQWLYFFCLVRQKAVSYPS